MKVFKKLVSVFLAVAICLVVFPGTMSIKSSAVKYAYTGNLDTSVTGTHHWPGNCFGGTSIKALGANEISTSQYVYNTDREGTAGQVDTREMNDSDVPVATYYVDANDSDYTVTLLCEMTADTFAKIINCQFNASDETKKNCSISDVGWNTQWYFKNTGVSDTFSSKTIEFTGKTPSAPGQQVEYVLRFLTDIANGQTGYIHAVYKLKIRFVAFGGSDSGKTTVTNHILRNWTDLYCYDAIMSAYNVDGGTNGEYINTADGSYAASDSDFELKSTATAFAYIDRTQYSRLEDTPISFSHYVHSLCAAGTDGWSWAGIRVRSSSGSFTSSIGYVDYTIDNNTGTSFLNNVYNLPFKVCGDLPAAGEPLTVTVSGYYNANATKNGFNYNAYTDLILTLYLYDKTELNTALNNAVAYLDSKSSYSQQSFADFENAYYAALAASNSQTAKQSEIDAAKNDLINAVSALERVQTVTFDSQSATEAGTASVVAVIGQAMPSITLPTRDHYSFVGYYTQPNGAGIRYYNADGSSARDFDIEQDVVLYANWTVNTYTVTFKNGSDVLQSDNRAYNTMPTYDGDTPVKADDDRYEYTFSGWSPDITAVTGEAIYVAQFSQTAHDWDCVKLDESRHQYVCKNCSYNKAAENHSFVYKKLDDGLGYYYLCAECGYSYMTEAEKYSVQFECNDYSAEVNDYIKSTCEEYVNQNPPVLREDLSKNYYLASIQAPLKINSDGQMLYFVYWKDAETGEKVSTYTTYKFFQTGTNTFTPVYVTQQEYYSVRDEATIASRIVDCRENKNGSYSILAEHSVASSLKSINGHGVIYTTDSAYIDSLTLDNDNVEKKTAALSSRALTGLLEVTVNPDSASTIWARSYVIDSGGAVHYGQVKSFDISAQTASLGEEIVTAGAVSYDLTDINSDTQTPVEDDASDETKNSLPDILKTVVLKLIAIINEIISFFTKSEAKI